jgi:hypothetical protein
VIRISPSWSRACSTFSQMVVPTSTTDCIISRLTLSPSFGVLRPAACRCGSEALPCVDDLVLLLDADRQEAFRAHAGPSMTNVGTTLPAPAVTLSSAAAETRVMKPAGRPIKEVWVQVDGEIQEVQMPIEHDGNVSRGISTASWTT